jgi:NYN domain-containing protein
MRVFIDGENCRKGLADVLKRASVITSSREITEYGLKNLLADILENSDLTISYYASKIKLPHGHTPSAEVLTRVEQIREYTRSWVPSLERQGINYLKAGYLKVKSTKPCRNCNETQEVLQEKGVDVKVATDIVEHAFTNPDEPLVIFSSDSDLIPALNSAKSKGVHLTYICFAGSVNRAIDGVADETVSISTEKAKRYFTVRTATPEGTP